MTRRLALAAVALPLVCAISPAQAAEPPHRKPGLWEITGGDPPGTIQTCVDAASADDIYLDGGGAMKMDCPRHETGVSGSEVTVNSECRFAGSIQSTRRVVTFEGDGAYHVDLHSHYEPPFQGQSDLGMTMDAKWLGECPSDMEPGDSIGPGGIRMNVRKMLGGGQ